MRCFISWRNIELSVGILGEYIGHIYMEAKNRPIFILKETNLPLTKSAKEKYLSSRKEQL